MWKPALSVAEYLPSRSTIHAFCCGTTRAIRLIMIMAKMTTTTATRRLDMSSLRIDCLRRPYVDRQPDDLLHHTALTFCKRRLSNVARRPRTSPHLRFSFG